MKRLIFMVLIGVLVLVGTVQAATNDSTVVIGWATPTEYVDGTPLEDPIMYRVAWAPGTEVYSVVAETLVPHAEVPYAVSVTNKYYIYTVMNGEFQSEGHTQTWEIVSVPAWALLVSPVVTNLPTVKDVVLQRP